MIFFLDFMNDIFFFNKKHKDKRHIVQVSADFSRTTLKISTSGNVDQHAFLTTNSALLINSQCINKNEGII